MIRICWPCRRNQAAPAHILRCGRAYGSSRPTVLFRSRPPESMRMSGARNDSIRASSAVFGLPSRKIASTPNTRRPRRTLRYSRRPRSYDAIICLIWSLSISPATDRCWEGYAGLCSVLQPGFATQGLQGRDHRRLRAVPGIDGPIGLRRNSLRLPSNSRKFQQNR